LFNEKILLEHLEYGGMDGDRRELGYYQADK